MPIRSFNYTGRRRITREEISLRLNHLPDKPSTFDAEIRLDKHHKLPPNAAVCVEAYRGSSASWMRFPFGTAGALKVPADRRLTDFDGADGILFRIRVTSSENPGLLLAEADKLSPRASDAEEHSRLSILPVRSDKTLEKRVWRLDFKDEPVLLVNSALGEKWDIVRDQAFMALVMPEVLEAILIRILLVDKYPDDQDEEDGSWQSKWLRFVHCIPETNDRPDVDENDALEDWIEGIVGAFSRKLRILDQYEGYRNRSDK